MKTKMKTKNATADAATTAAPTSRKRERFPKSGDSTTNSIRLTVAELAQTLQLQSDRDHDNNSNKARAICDCLRRFTAIVRHERQIALHPLLPQQLDDDGDDDDTDTDTQELEDDEDPLTSEVEEEEEVDKKEEQEEDEQPSPKRRRRQKSSSDAEAWKEDTQNYNVPFVGTSVYSASRVEKYPVVPGAWPTGFLEAYLHKSPLAVEFLEYRYYSNHQRQQEKDTTKKRESSSAFEERAHHQRQQQAIIMDKAYLGALNELVTAAIPIEKLLLLQNNNKEKKQSPPLQGKLLLDHHEKTAISQPQQQSPPRFLNELIQKQLPRLVTLFLEEATTKKGSSSSISSSTATPKGALEQQQKPQRLSVRQQVGALVPRILQVFVSLSETIPSVAAKVVRSLLQESSSSSSSSSRNHQNNPWKVILQQQKQAPTTTTTTTKSEEDNNNNDETPTKMPLTTTMAVSRVGIQARRLAIQLATVWVQQLQQQPQQHGHYLLSSIATSGIHHQHHHHQHHHHQGRNTTTGNKSSSSSPPGLLFCVLKDGIVVDGIIASGRFRDGGGGEEDDLRLCLAVSRLLSALHDMLLQQHNHQQKQQQRQHQPLDDGTGKLWRSLGDILSSRECLSNLVRLATTLAPPLSSYEAVLQCQDKYENEVDHAVALPVVSERNQVGILARRLVFCLLADPNHSPLLAALKKAKKKTNRTSSSSTIAEQQLVRAMLLLFASSLGVEIQRFLAHCVETIPPPLLLAVPLLCHVPIPDCSSTLSFCKTMRFLVRVLRSTSTYYKTNTTDVDDDKPSLMVVWPANLKKHHLTKALQSSNALVVSSALQFLEQVLTSLLMLKELDSSDDDEFSALMDKNLPDPATVVRILSTWVKEGDQSTVTKCSSVVVFAACSVLPRLVLATTSSPTNATSLDWVKHLIPSTAGFAQSPLWLQRKLLACLEQVLFYKDIDEPVVATRSSPDVLMEIALTTKYPEVHKAARRIALSLFPCPRSTFSNDGDRSNSVEAGTEAEYEYSCWMDGVTQETLGELCALLRLSSQESMIRCRVTVAKAWKQFGLPGGAPLSLNVSSVMVLALQRLLSSVTTTTTTTTTLSPQLALLTCQVAAQCLLHHFDPIPLAALIAAYLPTLPEDRDSHLHPHLDVYQRNLSKYATSLVHFDSEESQDRVQCHESMVHSLFSSESLISAVTSPHWKKIFADDGSVSCLTDKEEASESLGCTFRHMSHLILVSDPRDQEKRAIQLFQFLLATILKMNPEGLWPVLKRVSQAVADPSSLNEVSAVDLLVRSSENLTAALDIPSWIKCAEIESLTSESFGEAAFYLYLIGPFVPVPLLCSLTTKVLEFTRDRTIYQEIGVLYIRRVIETDSYQYVFSDLALAAFECWRSQFLDASNINRDFLFCLDQLLCSCLSPEAPGSVSVALEAELMGSRDLVVSRCVSTKQLFQEFDATKHKCLLATLVECDTVVFAPLVLQRLVVADDDPETRSLLACGLFDQAIRNALRLREGLLSYPDASAIVTEHYLKRTLSCLANPLSCSVELESVLTVLPELVRLDTLKDYEVYQLNGRVVEDVTELLNPSYNGDGAVAPIDQMTPSVQEAIFRLAFVLSLRQSPIQCFFLQRMASALIFRLLLRLPTMIRSQTTRTLVIGWLCELLEASSVLGNFEWNAAVKPCLTYGLRLKSSRHDVETSLLKVALLLVKNVSSSDSLSATQILDAITRHSKFHSIVMLQDDDEAVSVKVSMLELMVYCASVAKEAVSFEEVIFDTLLQGFDAGTTTCDTLIRKLLHVYSHQAPEGSDCIMLDRLHWRGVQQSDASRDWSWLPEALESRRMNSTLSMFPIDDPLTFEIDSSERRETARSCSYSSSLRSTSTCGYSPGFLLPFVFSALESATGASGTPITVQSVHLAYKLCDKGCVALSLASLSSNCSSLRRVAVSILGKFTLIVDSTEARQYAAWRERPQIGMLLHSVQKCLSIRISEEGGPRGFLPKIPGMSALFLSRACLVLARPFDDMYSSINRYFLQSLTDNGAFQDLFRVPGFISMYSSSVDEPVQARSHRLWALKLVKDGFLDDDCFKPLVSCHAPELLLSSVDNFRQRNQSGEGREETCLLLNTLLKILDTGGTKTHQVLTIRFGVLHWLRSVLVGRPLLDVLPDAESRLLLLRITGIAVERGWKMLGKPEVSEWCSTCAQPIVELALHSIKDVKAKGVEQGTENLQWQLSSCASDLLSRLGQYMQDDTDTKKLDEADDKTDTSQTDGVDDNSFTTHPAGVRLESALELLLLTPDTCRPALALAFCRLPWRPVTDDDTTAQMFCLHVLALVDKIERYDFDVAMLKRIADVASCHEFDMCREIVQLLLLSRRRFNKQAAAKRELLNCVKILSDMDDDDY